VQPLVVSGLTAAQVTGLIRDSDAVTFSAGLELLDINLNHLDTLDDWFVGGSVGRDNYATLHGTAALSLTQELDWGTAIVRPSMTISDGVLSATFNLGAYLTSSPNTNLAENPITHEIVGYDILHWLNTPIGESYVVAAGTDYLTAVESILTTQGITQYQIDKQAAGTVLANDKVWAFSDNATWLNVINGLLAGIGYMGIYSDWNGMLRVEPYLLPTDRQSEWAYDTDPAVSMLSPDRTVVRDTFNAPNKWVFHWQQAPEGVQPVEGAGIYTFINQTNGPTSVAERGRVIAAPPQAIDVVDQASLVAKAQQSIDADLRLHATIELKTFPNPASWHFDRYTLNDPGVGPYANVLGVKWSLPLNGDDMSHVWSVL
jgi:hypothetical protein